MHGVLTTPPAVLLHLETVGRVGLVLGCDVVATLAFGAGERQRRSLVAWHRLALLDDLYDSAGADGAATFSDGETESFVHGDRCDQFHGHFRIVPGHDHLSPFGQLDGTGHISSPEIELGSVTREERVMPAAFLLGQDIDLSFEIGVRSDRPRFGQDLTPLHIILTHPTQTTPNVVACSRPSSRSLRNISIPVATVL